MAIEILGAQYFGDKELHCRPNGIRACHSTRSQYVQAYLRLGKVFEATGQSQAAICYSTRKHSIYSQNTLPSLPWSETYISKQGI